MSRWRVTSEETDHWWVVPLVGTIEIKISEYIYFYIAEKLNKWGTRLYLRAARSFGFALALF